MFLCDPFLPELKGLLLFILVVLLATYFLSKEEPQNFPPGPPALPLLGNVFSIEAKQPHIYLTKVRTSIYFHLNAVLMKTDLSEILRTKLSFQSC